MDFDDLVNMGVGEPMNSDDIQALNNLVDLFGKFLTVFYQQISTYIHFCVSDNLDFGKPNDVFSTGLSHLDENRLNVSYAPPSHVMIMEEGVFIYGIIYYYDLNLC